MVERPAKWGFIPDKFFGCIDLKPGFRPARIRPAKILAIRSVHPFCELVEALRQGIQFYVGRDRKPIVENVNATMGFPDAEYVLSLNRSRDLRPSIKNSRGAEASQRAGNIRGTVRSRKSTPRRWPLT